MIPKYRFINERYDFLLAWGGQRHSQYAATVLSNFLSQFNNPEDWYKWGSMRKLCFHFIVDDTVTKSDREKITNILSYVWKKQNIDKYIECNIYFYDAPKDYLDIFEQNKALSYGLLGANAYYRLLAPRILPQDVGNVLYLDTDIVLRNVQLIFNFMSIDISDIHIYGQRDLEWNYLPHDYIVYPYICSGVMLMNLDKMRKDKIYDKCIGLMLDKEYWKDANEYNKVFGMTRHDQDIINVLCDKKKALPNSFCYFPHVYYKTHVYSMAPILHTKWYAGKKWIKENIVKQLLPSIKQQLKIYEQVKKMWK